MIHSTYEYYRFVSNKVVMKSKAFHPTPSFNKFMENLLALILVTFILGMLATYDSKVHIRTIEKTGSPSSESKMEVWRAFGNSFIEPYTYACKRLKASTPIVLSSFDFTIYQPHISKPATSTLHCLITP